MTTPFPKSDRLDAVIALYLEAVERGEVPDRSAILAANPQDADALRAFFDDHDRMRSMAAAFREDATASSPFVDLTIDHQNTGGPHLNSGVLLKYVGDYEVVREIASGGMGVVYLARQMSLNRVVAVKMILAGALAGPEAVARFRREAESAAGLVRDDRPPRRALVSLLATVANAVDHAHHRGVLHRDLKPRNILVDGSGQPHVTDFGLARRLEADSDLTGSNAAPGTPSYMPPEQARGVRNPTTAVDIYGLGAILYEILTGRPPHRADSLAATLRLVLDAEPVAPRTLDPTIDRDLETTALKCLEKDPKRRYASAADSGGRKNSRSMN